MTRPKKDKRRTLRLQLTLLTDAPVSELLRVERVVFKDATHRESWIESAPEEHDPPLDAIVSAEVIGVCRKCGCTDERACLEGCSWVEEDLCSACVPTPATPKRRKRK